MNPEEFKLQQKIRLANEAYRLNRPFMTNSGYDKLWYELFKLNPNNPILYHTTRDPNLGPDIINHPRPVKGLQKALTTDGLHPFLTRFKDTYLLIEPKYDGVAAVLYRISQFERKLVLTGDGIAGRDISHHISRINFNNPYNIFDVGELIIPLDKWDSTKGANPRNYVAGCINSKSFEEKNIRFIPHHASNIWDSYKYSKGSYKDLHARLLQCYSDWGKLYPIDGLVLKVADLNLRLQVDTKEQYYVWAIAWKPPIQTKETTITDIEWNVSRNGRVIPTVIYEPINLCGTCNTRATGNNAFWLASRQLKKGSKVLIGKAGEIIPQIINKIAKDSYENFFDLYDFCPEKCPVCGAVLNFDGTHLTCMAEKCIAKSIQSIAYFYSHAGIYIKGIGTGTINKMLEEPILRNTLLTHKYALLDPVSFKIDKTLIAYMGEVFYNNLMESLDQINGKKTYLNFIAGMGIKNLAYKTILDMFKYIKTGKMSKRFPKQSVGAFLELQNIFREVQEKMKNFNFIEPNLLTEKLFCITGTLSLSRADAVSMFNDYGYIYRNGVTKEMLFLVVGDKPGIKKKKNAKEFGIPILTEEEALKHLDNSKKGG
jgi:DNA ligase (NAD+)